MLCWLSCAVHNFTVLEGSARYSKRPDKDTVADTAANGFVGVRLRGMFGSTARAAITLRKLSQAEVHCAISLRYKGATETEPVGLEALLTKAAWNL